MALSLVSLPGLVFLHLETLIICKYAFLLFFTSLTEFHSITSIFFFNFFALSKKRFGSPIVTIGILKFSHIFDADNLIIKSGPMPAGSPGEYIIFFNLDL